MFRQEENSGFACLAGGMGAEPRFINWGAPVGRSTVKRAPALSAGLVGAEEKPPPRAPVRSPGCPCSWAPARAHGPSARPPPPLQSSLSLPLTRCSPRSPGEGQEHTWGRGCAWSQGPWDPGTQPATARVLQGVTEPPDLPLPPQPPRASRHASLPPLHAYTRPPASGRTQAGTQEVSARAGGAGARPLTWCWQPLHLRCRTLAAASLLPSGQVEGGWEEPPWLLSGSASGWEGLAVGLGGWGSSRVCRKFKVRRMSSGGAGWAEKMPIGWAAAGYENTGDACQTRLSNLEGKLCPRCSAGQMTESLQKPHLH